jgi:hypothetical protein
MPTHPTKTPCHTGWSDRCPHPPLPAPLILTYIESAPPLRGRSTRPTPQTLLFTKPPPHMLSRCQRSPTNTPHPTSHLSNPNTHVHRNTRAQLKHQMRKKERPQSLTILYIYTPHLQSKYTRGPQGCSVHTPTQTHKHTQWPDGAGETSMHTPDAHTKDNCNSSRLPTHTWMPNIPHTPAAAACAHM